MIAPPPTAPVPWHASWVGKGLFAIALIFLLKEMQPVLVPISIAVVMTFVLAQPVRALHRHGVPQAVGSAIVVGALIGSVVLMAGSLAGPAAKWWERAPSTLAQVMEQWERVRTTIPILRNQAPAIASTQGVPNAPPPQGIAARKRAADRAMVAAAASAPAAAAAQQPDALGSTIAAEGIALTRVVVGRFMSFGLATIATVMLLYFLLASEHWIVARAVSALPRRRRGRVLVAVRRAQRDVGHFLRTLAIVNVGIGVATAVAVGLLGLENPILWGTMAGALNFIPYIGPLLTAGLLTVAGVLSFEAVGSMLAPAAAFLLLHGIEANFVSPWLIGKRVALSPVIVFASVMLMGWLWGLAGAMLTVPFLIGLRCTLLCIRGCRPWTVVLEGHTRDLPTLKALLQRKREASAEIVALRGSRSPTRARSLRRESNG